MSEPRPTAQADDCYSGDPELLPMDEALARIDAMLRPIADDERVALRDALGRILSTTVVSPVDVPGHTNSAMDGYALAATDLPADGERDMPVLGTAWAGRPFDGAVAAGACVRVMTGAVMPQGTDTVIMKEQVREADDGASVMVGGGHRPGQNVRQAGEDIAAGARVLEPGKRIMPAELGLLASLGIGEVAVKRRLRVAFFSTGDELRSIGEPLALGEVYDSNRYTLHGMLARLGVDIVDLGVVRDTKDAVRAAFEEAARAADVVISTGGASTGEADFIAETLAEIGEVRFWRIAIRPGRPLAFGRLGEALFFGLPGNPVAVMVTFYLLVQPALVRLMGSAAPLASPTVRVTCSTRLRKKPGRVEVYRAVLEHDADGRPTVRSTGKTGSGLLHTMSDANCFILLPQEAVSVEPGSEVEVLPFFGLA
ncbi:MAG: molybdopterin molybdotransferase MoeA [Gammaproteobacteria bacterium]|nr:molybdopterin molybdotransferase MoeA [Gammaproteobacteria bacterium]